MKRHLFVAVTVMVLASCAEKQGTPFDRSTSEGSSLYIAVALETAVGTLISLSQTGVLPPEGAELINAALAYGGGACKILNDPTLDSTTKRIALTTDLMDERAAFDTAFADLATSGLDRSVLLAVTPAMTGARAAVRIALTESVDPARYARPCESVQALAASWSAQRPAA